MINVVWLIMIVAGTITAAAKGEVAQITDAAIDQSQLGLETILGFMGMMIMWLGLMNIAEKSGLIKSLSNLVEPLLKRLIPEVPADHPAMGTILMNVSANLLGVGAAATPMGLKAMEHLQELNDRGDEASNAMCTFLALNTSGITLIPTTVIALRTAAGSANPTEIVGTALLATTCSSIVALSVDRVFRFLDSSRKAGG